jgi:hypothetical protein
MVTLDRGWQCVGLVKGNPEPSVERCFDACSVQLRVSHGSVGITGCNTAPLIKNRCAT